jgi:hypothetical protein
MLEPDQWDSVLSRARGTIYRGTECISSNALLSLLEVGPDPVTRRRNCFRTPPWKSPLAPVQQTEHVESEQGESSVEG